MLTRSQSKKGLLNEYKEIEAEGGSVYIRLDSFERIKAVDAIVFDCDGVLIDARFSYDAAIRRTLQHIFETLTGCRFPISIIPKKVIYNLRLSGGFNFDWDTTYVTALMVFKHLPKQFQKAFSAASKQEEGKTAVQRLLAASSVLLGKLPKDYFRINGVRLRAKLLKISKSRITDREAAERLLLDSAEKEGSAQYLRDFIRFLAYTSEASQSIISVVFDTYFYGSELFRELYGFESELRVERGLIEMEKCIVKEETLKGLRDMLGEGRMGLATGRGSLAAKKTLGDLLSYFNHKAMVFLEDLKYKMGWNEALIKPYVKPQPYSLLEATAGIGDAKNVLYVGNSAEDYILTERANQIKRVFLFTGCYALQNGRNKTIKLFKEAKADMIIPTVNDLPRVLEYIKRG